jgi:hypothetical protein
MNLKSAFEEAKAANTPAVFRNVFTTVPGWEPFLNHLELYKKEVNGFRTFGPTYYVLELFDHNLKNISDTYAGYSEVHAAVHEACEGGVWPRPVMLIATDLGNPELPRHRDPCDQMHWTCIGSEAWKVWVSEEEVLEFTLNPGDLIYIPIGLYHQVTSVTPRAGITWSAMVS